MSAAGPLRREKFPAGVRCEDRLHRTPDGRRFTGRLIISVWTDGHPAVITA